MKKSTGASVVAEPVTPKQTPPAPPKTWQPCLLTAAACLLALWVLLGLNGEAIRIPFSYSGDAMAMFTIAKNVLAGNWWFDFKQLGMPFGADWRDFPMHLTVDFNIVRVIGWMVHDAFIAVNITWLLTLIAASVFATFAFLELQIDRGVAVALGLVYGLQPYGWLRNVGHFNLMFYLVPLVAGWIVKTAAEQIDGLPEDARPWWKRVPKYVLIAAAAQGLSYAYNSFFDCFFLAMAALVVIGVRRSWRPLLPFALVMAVLVVFFALNMAPSYLYWHANGVNQQLVQKSAMESDYYGMKLRYLLLPILDHRIPLVRNVALGFNGAFPPENESGTARLGLVGALGFVYLLWTLFTGLFTRASGRGTLTRVLAYLAIAAVLLSIVGGFGSIFNTLISPDIRAYNRTVTYIEFFSLGAVAIVLTRWKQILLRRGISALLLNGALALLAICAVLDESPSQNLRAYWNRSEIFDADRAFGKRIEASFPAGAMIFQLPHTGFPIDSKPNGQEAYVNSLPYLHTDHLKWSWGAIEGRKFEWGASIASLPPDAMLQELKKAGFSGLWLNAEGYPDPDKVLGPLTELLGKPIVTHTLRRHYVFDLRGSGQQLTERGAGLSTDALVRAVYRDFWGSSPDAAKVRSAVDRIQSTHEPPAHFVEGYLNSPDFRRSGVFVATCYIAMLDRDPDLQGWQHWTGELLRHGMLRTTVIDFFIGAPEFAAHFGSKTGPEIIATVYRQAGLPASDAKSTIACLNSGKCNMATALETAFTQPEFENQTLRRLRRKLLYFVLLSKDPGNVDVAGKSDTPESQQEETGMIDSILGSKVYQATH